MSLFSDGLFPEVGTEKMCFSFKASICRVWTYLHVTYLLQCGQFKCVCHWKWNVYCLALFQVVWCVKENLPSEIGYHASHVLVTGFQLFQLHECLIMSACIVCLITWIIPWSSWDCSMINATLDTFAYINWPIVSKNSDLPLCEIKRLLYFQLQG